VGRILSGGGVEISACPDNARAVTSSAPATGGSDPQPSGPNLPDEDKLDAPSRQTLWMLGVVCASTLVMWAMGRLACNYHVPGESLTPRALTFEDRSRTSKDAALEFAFAVESGDFKTASELVDGAAKTKLSELEKGCSDCAARKAKKDSILMVGTVLADNGSEAYVSTSLEGGARGAQKSLFHLKRGAKYFQVVEILSLDAPIPVQPEPPPGFHLNPASKVPASLRRPASSPPSSAPPASAAGTTPGAATTPAKSTP
jgi:hypothetical protein